MRRDIMDSTNPTPNDGAERAAPSDKLAEHDGHDRLQDATPQAAHNSNPPLKQNQPQGGNQSLAAKVTGFLQPKKDTDNKQPRKLTKKGDVKEGDNVTPNIFEAHTSGI
jgi:hypothetical protein